MKNVLSKLFARPRDRRRPFGSNRASSAGIIEPLEDRTLLSAGSLINRDGPYHHGSPGLTDVAALRDGRIVVVGTSGPVTGNTDAMVARFSADGLYDTSFDGETFEPLLEDIPEPYGRADQDGWRRIDFGGQDEGTAIAVQFDGRLLVGAVTNDGNRSRYAIACLNGDGTLDTAFGTGGKVVAPPGTEAFAATTRLAVDRDGRIVVAFSHHGGTLLTRYSADGLFDASFGYVTAPTFVTAVTVDAAGRIVAANADGSVFRLTTSGALDASFGGRVRLGFGTPGATVLTGVAIGPQGHVHVAGHFWDGAAYRAGVARLSTNGVFDPSFGDGGRVSFDVTPGADDFLWDIAVLGNGAVVVAGDNGLAAGDWVLAVLTPGGLLDAGFDGDGVRTWNPSKESGATDPIADFGAAALAVTAEGHYAVAGGFDRSDFGNESDNAFALFEGLHPAKRDLLGWTDSGHWYLAASTGYSFNTYYYGSWDPNAGWGFVETADLNGDGRDDAIGRDAAGVWWAGLNTGGGLATSRWGKWNEAANWRDVKLADFNGDGRADVAGRTDYGEWWVSLSAGTRLAAGARWASWNEAANWRDVTAADVTGDGATDLLARTSDGEWHVAASARTTFSTSRWAVWREAGWRNVQVADFDGNGLPDVAAFSEEGSWYVARNANGVFQTSHWGYFPADWQFRTVGDFDRDGLTEFVGRVGSYWLSLETVHNHGARSDPAGHWQFWNRFSGQWDEAAGWRDVIVGDFDGDGRDDAVGRTAEGEWFFEAAGIVATGNPFDGPPQFGSPLLWAEWRESAGWRVFDGEFG